MRVRRLIASSRAGLAFARSRRKLQGQRARRRGASQVAAERRVLQRARSSSGDPMSGRRIAALGALVIGLAALGFRRRHGLPGLPEGPCRPRSCVRRRAGRLVRRPEARSGEGCRPWRRRRSRCAGALLLFLDDRAVEIALILGGVVVAESPGADRLEGARTAHARRRAQAPGADLQPEVGRREGREVLTRDRGAGAWHRSQSSSDWARTSRRSSAMQWRVALTGSPWREATDRRQSLPRSPRSSTFLMHAFRPERETISPSTSESIATMWSGRSTRS